jgi:hypothetical protein
LSRIQAKYKYPNDPTISLLPSFLLVTMPPEKGNEYIATGTIKFSRKNEIKKNYYRFNSRAGAKIRLTL